MQLRDGEVPQKRMVRFRTLGCYPLSGAIESTAATLPDAIDGAAAKLQKKLQSTLGRLGEH
jgi:sulfate adenylyltransferase subunit 2